MRIIISPAKKMNADTDSLPARDLPAFLERTEALRKAMQSKSAEELQKLWKCNDQIANLNIQRRVQLVRDIFSVFLALSDTLGQKILDLPVDRPKIILRPGGHRVV